MTNGLPHNDVRSPARAGLSAPTPISPFALLAFLGLFLMTGSAVYWPALTTFFHGDDFGLIEKVRQGGPFALWTYSPSPFLRPVIGISLFLDGRLWGLNAAGYHLTNVLLHALNAAMISWIALWLLTPGADSRRTHFLALIAGVLYLVHPSHPEAVAWVSGRTDVIAAFFTLASFLAYLSYRWRPRLPVLAFSLALFALGLLSKEAVASYPLVLFAYECYRVLLCKDSRRRALRTPIPFLLMLPAYLALRYALLGVVIGGYGTAAHLSSTPLRLLLSTCFFFFSGFLPQMPRFLFCAAVFVLILVALMVQVRAGRKIPPVLGFLVAAFILAFLPALSLGGGGAPTGESGRLVYFPAVFSVLALAVLLGFFLQNTPRLLAAAACLAMVFGYQLHQSLRIWHEAGELSRTILDSLTPVLPARTLLVLAVPDRLYPAFIYRNGFGSALNLFHSGKVGNLVLVSTPDLYSPADSLILSREDSSAALRLAHAARPVYPRPIPLITVRSEYHEAALRGDKTLTVTWKNLGREDRVVYYTGGRMVPVP